ncbi:FG-GAP-like repeat-containing protein [Pseudolysobacter antarcticus]|nr:FG-GAP-like repeat-containing protein [Pseudolysobacter antarcticus]
MYRINKFLDDARATIVQSRQARQKRFAPARTLMAIAAVSLWCVAISAHAANIYGAPGVQPASIGGSFGAPFAATTADFNNDGYPDVAVIKNNNNDTGGLAIYTADPIGTLTLRHDYGVFNFKNPTGVTAADVNGDGIIDLIVTDDIGVSVLLGVGDNTATFVAASPQHPALADAYRHAYSAAVADINHDGKPDIVTLAWGTSTTYVEVLLGSGGGKFVSAYQYDIDSADSLSLAKVDADAELDIILATGDKVSVMKGLGTGSFIPLGQVLDVSGNVYLTFDTQTTDLDGDGKIDLVMTNTFGNGVWFAKGNGNGSFQTPKHLYATGVPSDGGRDMGQTVIADVNGDGRLDVVSDGYVLLQQADHSFVYNQHIGYSQTRMLIGVDLNGDGRADMITRGPGLSDIAIFKTSAGAVTHVLESGSPQSTVFGTAFATPLSLTILDENNAPVPNLQVIFSAPTGVAVPSASGFVGSTNAQGKVSYTAVANNVFGCYTLHAVIQGYNGGNPENFNLCNIGANVLAVTTGDNQSTLVNTAFATPLQVKLTDDSNVPKSGVTVNFSAPNSGARAVLSAASAVTDANGLASVTATAASMSGSYNIAVSAAGATPTAIKLSNSATAGSAALIYVDVSNPQYAYVTKAFSGPIVIHVQDFFGNPVAGETVLYQITPDAGTGASAVFSALSAVTNLAGDAQVTAVANGFAGQYTVKVSVQGSLITSPQTFQLRNIADLVGAMSLESGTPQSTLVNTSFAQKLRVRVVNSDGLATPQVQVFFLASGGATLSAISVLADANGYAEVTATADSTVGAYQVTAIVDGDHTSTESDVSQVFNLTNLAPVVVQQNVQQIPSLSTWSLLLLGVLLATLGAMWQLGSDR